MRSTLFFWMVFFVSPVLLAATGSIAELLRNRYLGSIAAPWTWYLAGFIGAVTAISLVLAEGAMTQYVPFMEPGLLTRVAFVIGYMLFCLPVVLPVSAVFAFCSLAGGALTRWKRERGKPGRE